MKVAGCGVCHTDLGLPLRRGAHQAEAAAGAGARDLRRGARRRRGRRAVARADGCWCRRSRPAATAAGARAAAPPPAAPRRCRATTRTAGSPATSRCPPPPCARWTPGGAKLAEDAPIGKEGLALWEISVVADAVSTPVQAIKRCGLGQGRRGGGHRLRRGRHLRGADRPRRRGPRRRHRHRPGQARAGEGVRRRAHRRRQDPVQGAARGALQGFAKSAGASGRRLAHLGDLGLEARAGAGLGPAHARAAASRSSGSPPRPRR